MKKRQLMEKVGSETISENSVSLWRHKSECEFMRLQNPQ